MGTRADFYVGFGAGAVWLGSIAWDGYPEGIPDDILEADTEKAYRDRVSRFLDERKDGTKPEQGWPWPWENSLTTDYAYAFETDAVMVACFGRGWNPATIDEEDWLERPDEKNCVFPDMTHIQDVTLGARSGMIIMRG